ncbi:MAG: FG-GAP repeat domain-containing protein [Planctomycetota bacterium]
MMRSLTPLMNLAKNCPAAVQSTALVVRLPVWLALLAAPLTAQQFLYNAAALPAQSVWTDGVELVDVDADGDIDILFANGNVYGGTGTAGAQPQHLFLNNGGVFTAAHSQLNVANFNAKMVIAEDFDNDGDPDLAYASGSTGSPPRLLLNDGTGNFTDVTLSQMPLLFLRSFSIVAGDVEGDGDLDLAVSDGGTFGGVAAQARLLINDGAANFTDETAQQMPVDLFNCQDITFLDFDGDFDVDMLLTGKGAAGKRGRLYLNSGAGHFVISAVMNEVGTGATYEGDWADLDGDNDFDCSIQSINGANEGWARNDGTGAAMAEFTFPAPNGGDDNELAHLDYDNDGDPDCFVGSLAGQEKLYRNDGGGVFVNHNAAIQAQADSTLDFGFADLDGNGTYDMVTAQGESGNFTNKIYFNNGPADTLPPVFIGTHIGVSAPDLFSHFELQLADAVSDDGHISAEVSFTYVTDAGSGSGVATRMGGGLFKARVPNPTGATTGDVLFVATDPNGNSDTFSTLYDIEPIWTDVGSALAGTGGISPLLTGSGPLTPNSINTVQLTQALAGTDTNIVVGLSVLNAAFKGGTLVPFPDSVYLSLPVDGTGTHTVNFMWPIRIPPGTQFWIQHWVEDGGGPVGYAASNALRGVAQ